jgi:hypothetical protein
VVAGPGTLILKRRTSLTRCDSSNDYRLCVTTIYTDLALEATNSKSRDIQQGDGLTSASRIARTTYNDRHCGMDQDSAQIDPTQAKATELAVESEDADLGAALLI